MGTIFKSTYYKLISYTVFPCGSHNKAIFIAVSFESMIDDIVCYIELQYMTMYIDFHQTGRPALIYSMPYPHLYFSFLRIVYRLLFAVV